MAKANKTEEVIDQATEQAVEQAVEQSVPESISLNDLQLLLQIVDLASKRGAFQGAELSQVGGIFDKLNAFLAFVAQQQAEASDAEEGSAEQE